MNPSKREFAINEIHSTYCGCDDEHCAIRHGIFLGVTAFLKWYVYDNYWDDGK